MKKHSCFGKRPGRPAYRTAVSFREKVLRAVKRIPKGRTMSYKEIAQKANSPRAYRAVGNILSKNYDPKIPCHRVIRANGETGGYNRGKAKKAKKLKQEKAI